MMSKEHILHNLKENKTYKDTVLSLWSGSADYQDYLASAMMIIGYDLRQNIADLTMLELGQNNEGTNKVIQLHGKNKSLILWYTNGNIIPILAYKENGKLFFSLYSHENEYLKGYVDGLATKELYNASDTIFNNLVDLVTSEVSPLSKQLLLHEYTLDNTVLITALLTIMDDYSNMTTNIGPELTEIYELLKSESNKEIYLPVKEDIQEGAPIISPYITKMNYLSSVSSYAYREYQRFIKTMVEGNNRSYSDGTRIVISKDLSEIKIYDNKGLYYTVPILKLTKEFESYEIDYTHGEFLRELEFKINIAKRANELYAKLGDLKGAEFLSAEVIWGRVNLQFKKTDWNTNKVVEGTIFFKLDDPDYDITFKTKVSGVSQKLKLSDGETLVLPSTSIEYTKTVHTSSKDVAQAFHVGLYYVTSAKLADLLQTNGLLVQNKDK